MVVTVPEVPRKCTPALCVRSPKRCSSSKSARLRITSLNHRLIALGRHLAPAMTLGEADHADRQRGPGRDAVLRLEPVVDRDRAPRPRCRLLEIEPDQLRAAAADIEHQRPVAFPVDQRGAARDRELGLGLAADDLDGKTGVGASRAR